MSAAVTRYRNFARVCDYLLEEYVHMMYENVMNRVSARRLQIYNNHLYASAIMQFRNVMQIIVRILIRSDEGHVPCRKLEESR